jgi:hypothetical protein
VQFALVERVVVEDPLALEQEDAAGLGHVHDDAITPGHGRERRGHENRAAVVGVDGDGQAGVHRPPDDRWVGGRGNGEHEENSESREHPVMVRSHPGRRKGEATSRFPPA